MKSISQEEEIVISEYRQENTDPIIMVMGVGGGGGNIVTEMYQQSDFGGVSFVLCNTDAQDLFQKHKADKQIQLGSTGLGAGANQEKGQQCAEYPQTQREIKECLTASESLQMLFIVATLGGGTGTGAAPVIARLAKEIEKPTENENEKDSLLVIGVVTLPNKNDGEGAIKVALAGLKELMKHTDAVIIIRNEGALKALGADSPCSDGDRELNKIPIQAVKAISWIVNEGMKENVDFNDIKNILKDGESALISIGYGSGQNRMKDAIHQATHSHFLNNRDLFKAKRLMYCIFDNSGEYGKEVELKLGERDKIIPNEFLAYFQQIEVDEKEKKKRIIRGVDNKFPEFEKKDIIQKDTVGLIVLATGFMFQQEDFYEPSDWGFEDEAVVEKEPNLKATFYDDSLGNSKNLINLSSPPYILLPHLLDNEAAIRLLERQNPAFRDGDTRKEYDRIAQKNKRLNPLDKQI